MAALTKEQIADVEKVDNPDVEAEEAEETEGSEEGEDVEADEEEEEADDLSAQELQEARNLYKALKDPSSRSLVLTDLARAAGITPDSTKKEVTEAKKGIQDILDETLGPQYKFLTPSLGKAIEKILDGEREERDTQHKNVEAQIVQQQVDSALGRLSRETKGESRKHEGRMVQLMNQFQASPGTDIYTYLQGIYSIATSGKSARVATQQVTDKIKRNSKDAFGRLQPARGSHVLASGTVPNKKMNLNQSIKWAMDQIEK